jgi:hypothetical protein
MVTVAIEDGKAVFEVHGVHRILALRSRLEIPLEHIVGVSRAKGDMPGWTDWLHLDGAKIMGAHVPGIIAAGTFYHRDGWVFWDVHDMTKAIEVRLADEEYSRLVVEVEHPDAAIAVLEGGRVARRQGGR